MSSTAAGHAFHYTNLPDMYAAGGIPQYLAELAASLARRDVSTHDLALLAMAPAIVTATIPRAERKQQGIYFTRPAQARLIALRIEHELSQGAHLFDPAMGAGDLLLASAELLPRGRTLRSTIRLWSELLSGVEMRSDFILVAKRRLALLAKTYHNGTIHCADVDELFGGLRVTNFFDYSFTHLLPKTCIVTNPPFAETTCRMADSWTPVRTSLAASFLAKLCREAPDDTHIVGLFPEVMRCGSSYSHMRDRVQSYVNVLHEERLGVFAPDADIDVFIGHYHKPQRAGLLINSRPVKARPSNNGTRIADLFQIRVGSVVPYRAVNCGPWRRYISAADVPPWSKGFEPHGNRRHRGTLYAPPFVVVRRTSSPRQQHRAVASVIVGSAPVAVENHLLVLTPNDNSVVTCQQLVDILQSPYVDEYFNEVMRCRHLTVGSVAEVRTPL